MTRADRRFQQGFRRLVGREPNETEWRFWHRPPHAETAEEARAAQEWTLRMHDLLTLQGRK
jgi:hypothetical protein